MVILRISHPKSRGKTRLFFFHLAKIFFSPPLSIPSLTSKYLTSSPGNISFVNTLGWGLAGMWAAFILDENIRALLLGRRWRGRKWALKFRGRVA